MICVVVVYFVLGFCLECVILFGIQRVMLRLVGFFFFQSDLCCCGVFCPWFLPCMCYSLWYTKSNVEVGGIFLVWGIEMTHFFFFFRNYLDQTVTI